MGCENPDVASNERGEDAPPAESARAAVPLPAALPARVHDHLSQFGRNWPDFRFHGAVLVARGDTVAVDEAFGDANLIDGTKNHTDTVFRIGTLSSQLVAGAVVRLVQQGRLRLDDTVADHLEGWPKGDSITIEHLLSHQSGLPNFTDDMAFRVWKRGPRQLDQTLELFRGQPLLHPPGEQTSPSNSNYVVLGAIVEAATGMPHHEAVRQLVLDPLGMQHTHYGEATEGEAVALGMLYREDETLVVEEQTHPSAFGPAGGWLSTTGDLLRWVRGVRDRRLFDAHHTEALLGLHGEDRLGYAWSAATVANREAVTWPGLIDGFSASLLYIPDDDTTIIVLSNAEVLAAGQLVDDIAQLAYGAQLPARDEPTDVPVEWSQLEPLAGRYLMTRGTEDALAGADAHAMVSLAEIFVQAKDEQLTLVVPGHGNKRMHPLDKGRFFFKDAIRTTARVSWRPDAEPIFVLSSGGMELRFVKATEQRR